MTPDWDVDDDNQQLEANWEEEYAEDDEASSSSWDSLSYVSAKTQLFPMYDAILQR
jgi:hypothetical protein